MKFFIIILNFLFFTPQIFAADYDFDVPYEKGAHTIGWSNPSGIRLSFATNVDLTGYFKSQGIDNIILSLSGYKISIPASRFVETARTSINDNFRIFDNDRKCSFVGQMHNLKFSENLYRKHTTPSGEALYDVGNPLEAIRFELSYSEEKLALRTLTKYTHGDKLSFTPPSFDVRNPFPSWYEAFAQHGKSLMFLRHYGEVRSYYFQKLLRLGYDTAAKEGLLEVARNSGVYLHQRLEIAKILSDKFQE